MANRVFGTLAEWSTLADDALDDKIRLSTGTKPEPGASARARDGCSPPRWRRPAG